MFVASFTASTTKSCFTDMLVVSFQGPLPSWSYLSIRCPIVSESVTHVSERVLPISPVYTLGWRGDRGVRRFAALTLHEDVSHGGATLRNSPVVRRTFDKG